MLTSHPFLHSEMPHELVHKQLNESLTAKIVSKVTQQRKNTQLILYQTFSHKIMNLFILIENVWLVGTEHQSSGQKGSICWATLHFGKVFLHTSYSQFKNLPWSSLWLLWTIFWSWVCPQWAHRHSRPRISTGTRTQQWACRCHRVDTVCGHMG